ncbi:toll/interleukin-1 receptor domain-containing protein [Conexibacter woesei]|uniref:toll/interleukin-1 receptor domain-containing protein n=1 Tax=Conexibacter woesei TaxID=191495 RepID=UPI00068860E9|nr:toll/interleukin-1 receptor domain-containing protein [Conexibacter woesei]
MASGRFPSSSEILDALDRAEHDENLRLKLQTGYGVFEICVAAGAVDRDGIDWVAQSLQKLDAEGLVAHGPANLGVAEPALWDGFWLQSVHGWRLTAAGRQDAALFRAESEKLRKSNTAPMDDAAVSHEVSDVFISHASEDKAAVARPLAAALDDLGWDVWLDELELTVGDSLHNTINGALAKSRFGVVVLSPRFFQKQWAISELAGLAAREVESRSKVILPVWHEVDRAFLVEHMPILADRLGAPTSEGIADVARKLDAALRRAERGAQAGLKRESVVQPVVDATESTLPTSEAEQHRMASERPRAWEYMLFAGVLEQGRLRLEPKWHDQELQLARGRRRDVPDDEVADFVSRQMGVVTRQLTALDRLLSAETQEQAFGAPGQPGDPVRITHLANSILGVYEALLDWSAELRNTSVPRIWSDAIDASASMVNLPVRRTRDFIVDVATQFGELPALLESATESNPVVIELNLVLEVDDDDSARAERALDEVVRRATEDDD